MARGSRSRSLTPASRSGSPSAGRDGAKPDDADEGEIPTIGGKEKPAGDEAGGLLH
jgi:hypothetical protein